MSEHIHHVTDASFGADLAALLLQVAEQGERRSAAGPAAGVYHAGHPAPPTAGPGALSQPGAAWSRLARKP